MTTRLYTHTCFFNPTVSQLTAGAAAYAHGQGMKAVYGSILVNGDNAPPLG